LLKKCYTSKKQSSFYERTIPLIFETTHTSSGSFILPVRTIEQENYKKQITNHIKLFL